MLVLFLLIVIIAVVSTYVLTIALPFQRQLVIYALSKLSKEGMVHVDEKHRILDRLDNDVSKFLRPMIKEWLSLEEYR